MWYPGSGVVLDCIFSLSLQSFILLRINSNKQLTYLECWHLQSGKPCGSYQLAYDLDLFHFQIGIYIGPVRQKEIQRKIVIIFLSISLNISLCAQKNRLSETVLLSTHNICFEWEIRLIKDLWHFDRVSAYFSDASQNFPMYKISLVSFLIGRLMY